jgi:predicted ester cyclase
VPPTGKSVTAPTIAIFRFAGGRIAEVWFGDDGLGVMQQLGLVPAPGAPPSEAAQR